MHIKIKLISASFIIFNFFASCSKGSNSEIEAANPEIPVEIQVVTPQKQKSSFKTFGQLKGYSEAKVFPFVSGVIRTSLIKEGDYVNKGQILFYIDQSSRGVEFSDFPVKSPTSGIISSLNYVKGDMVLANDSLLCKIVAPYKYKVDLYIRTGHLTEIKRGDRASVVFNELSGLVLDGVVANISPTVNQDSQNVKTEIVIYDAKNRIKSGMACEVEIKFGDILPKIFIPYECILFGKRKQYVYLVSAKNIVIKRRIEIYKVFGNLVQVKSGLRPADMIIVRGQYIVLPQSKVRIINKNQITLGKNNGETGQ